MTRLKTNSNFSPFANDQEERKLRTNAPEENHGEVEGVPTLLGSRDAEGLAVVSSTASFLSILRDEDSELGIRGGTWVFLNFFLGGSAQSKFMWKSIAAIPSSDLKCERMAQLW